MSKNFQLKLKLPVLVDGIKKFVWFDILYVNKIKDEAETSKAHITIYTFFLPSNTQTTDYVCERKMKRPFRWEKELQKKRVKNISNTLVASSIKFTRAIVHSTRNTLKYIFISVRIVSIQFGFLIKGRTLSNVENTSLPCTQSGNNNKTRWLERQ